MTNFIRQRMSGDRRRGSLENLMRTRVADGGLEPRIIETDCFACEENHNVGDVRCWIGDSLAWNKPLYQECTIPLAVWFPGGLNCQLWGNVNPTFPTCGSNIVNGSTKVKFHSVGIEPFGGVNLLQRKPDGACEWRKRHVKGLQQLWHDARTLFDEETGEVSETFPSAHVDIVTYPYLDPIDPADQWSRPVFPETATSPNYPYPVVDARCFTPFGPWPISGPGSGPFWQCENYAIQNTLSLSIVRLAHYLGNPANPLLYDPRGERYWELELVAPQTWAANTNLVTTGAFGMAGIMTGAVSPYGGRLGAAATMDDRNPAVDLAACPPYYKIGDGSYCSYGPGSNQLFSGYDPTILRWVKKLDCNTDFEGNPLLLDLSIPRAFIEGFSNPWCSNKHLNAEKFSLAGYSETAVVELLHD